MLRYKKKKKKKKFLYHLWWAYLVGPGGRGATDITKKWNAVLACILGNGKNGGSEREKEMLL